MKQPDPCVCDAQLQPHDRLEGVCPEPEAFPWPLMEREYEDAWRDLGGEG